jgi:sigma-B regulation protein RsbU (phosphoserine phosphatase)
MGGIDWGRVLLVASVIACVLLITEAVWMRQRKQRTLDQEFEWANTQRSIRHALSDPSRPATLAEVKLRALSNQAHLDQVCQSTANALNAPAAVITVVEHMGQRWLAYYGADWCDDETKEGLLQPLETSYCQYVVATDHTLVISDSLRDIRVRTNAEGTKEMVRAYIGAPVHTVDGVVVGSLCVFDHRPRKWSTRDRTVVESFAELVRL